MIISLSKVKKMFNGTFLLNDITFTINKKDKIALVGLNGCGKTTIFKIIKDLESVDDGEVFIRKDTTISYLEQIPVYEKSVKEVLELAFEKIFEIQSEMNKLENTIKNDPNNTALIKRYGELQNNFNQLEGYSISNNLKIITNGLKINDDLLSRNFMTLSGGEKSRVILAKILLEKPDCLLLDEPSNHLDMESISFLENYLTSYDGAVVIISHDRYLLDKVVNKIINIEDGKSYEYKANYTKYLELKQDFINQKLQEYEAQTKKIKNLESQIAKFKLYAKMGGGAKMDKKAKSRMTMLNKIEKIDKPENTKNINLQFKKPTRSSKEVLKLTNYSKNYGKNSLIKPTDFTIYSKDRVFLIGKNGTGKTSLFKSIMNETDYCGELFLAKSSKVAYFKQEFNYKDPNKTILQEIQSTLELNDYEARSALAKFLFFGEDVFKKVNTLSGGEKAKLELCKLVNSDFNVLLLDEPTNHLDIESKEMLELALEQFDGTIFCISHDRYFIKKLASSLLELKDQVITNYIDNFDEVFNSVNEKIKNIKTATVETDTNKSTKLSNNKRNEYLKKYDEIENKLIELDILYNEELKKENIDFKLIEEFINNKEFLESEAFKILEILEES